MLNLAIFMPYTGLSTNIQLLSLAENLAQKGARIDLFVFADGDSEQVPDAFTHSRIRVIDLGEGLATCRTERHTFDDFVPPLCLERLEDEISRQFYDYMIAVESVGLMYADQIHKQRNWPFAYFSQRLTRVGDPGSWTNTEVEFLKAVERKFLKHADLFIIQDSQREESFFENLRTNHRPKNIIHIPAAVADAGFPPDEEYWHKRFDLLPENRVILSVGRFDSLNIKKSMLDSFLATSDENILILHGTVTEDAMEVLRPHLPSGRIFLSRKLLNWRQIPSLVASADLGLACHYEFNIDQYLSGRASPILAYFAMYGIPVISPNFSTFREVVNDFNNGVVISYPNEIAAAIEVIEAGYMQYSAGARDAFDELYNVEIYTEQLWNHIRDRRTKGFLNVATKKEATSTTTSKEQAHTPQAQPTVES